ncbi:hypothetical protein ElyMa_000486800 [Elysia marginata]|uniref:Transmembrane protein n=1 Tax=Elysia marginata TaxID=1093978 RepID=A0AAV4FT29_9GAST|nr:hypothetical protein ElyMa_000486800 [Elysia marginata]
MNFQKNSSANVNATILLSCPILIIEGSYGKTAAPETTGHKSNCTKKKTYDDLHNIPVVVVVVVAVIVVVVDVVFVVFFFFFFFFFFFLLLLLLLVVVVVVVVVVVIVVVLFVFVSKRVR